MKKLFQFLCTLGICLLLSVVMPMTAKTKVLAEGVSEEVTSSMDVNSSDIVSGNLTTEGNESDWIVTPIVAGVFGLAGTIFVVAGFKGKLKVLVKAFNTVVDWFTKKTESLANEEVDLKKYKTSLEEAVSSNEQLQEKLKESMLENQQNYESFVKQVDENRLQNEKDMLEIKEEYKMIKNVLMQMAAGNPDLIRMGVADKIVKQLETDSIEPSGE